MDDLIRRVDALVSIKALYPNMMPIIDIFDVRRKWLEKYTPYLECEKAIEQLQPVKPQEPSGETVSLEAFKQVMRERDIAIEQLKELGYGFGQKIEPKTGHWIVKKDCEGKTRKCICDKCGYETGKYTWKNPNYCADCGVRMIEERSE